MLSSKTGTALEQQLYAVPYHVSLRRGRRARLLVKGIGGVSKILCSGYVDDSWTFHVSRFEKQFAH